MPRLAVLLLLATPRRSPPTGRSSSARTETAATAEKIPAWKDKPKELWKKPVGEAHSSPVVADGLVYVFAKVDKKDEDSLTAYDAKTGDEKWTKSYERAKFNPPFGSGPRGTPTVVGRQGLHLRRHGGARLLGRQERRDQMENGHAEGVQRQEHHLRREHVAHGGGKKRWW